MPDPGGFEIRIWPEDGNVVLRFTHQYTSQSVPYRLSPEQAQQMATIILQATAKAAGEEEQP